MTISVLPPTWSETFNLFDHDKDGLVSASDILQTFICLGQASNDFDLCSMFASIGISTEVKLDVDKFSQLLCTQFPKPCTVSREQVQSLYANLDLDGGGYFTGAELLHALTKMNIHMEDAEVTEMLSIFDRDGNNKISFDEFENVLQSMGYIVGIFEEIGIGHGIYNSDVQVEANITEKYTRPNVPTEQHIQLSTLSGEALQALQRFDFNHSGTVDIEHLKQAAELLKSKLHNSCSPTHLPADNIDKQRGIREYIGTVNHIALIVTDVARSARFYSDVLGFEQIRRPNFDKHGAWFTMGNIELHLIKGKPAVHNGDDLIVNHISITAPNIEKIPAMLKKLKVPFRQNVSVPKERQATEDGGTNVKSDSDKIVRQFFIRDPDGYYIEICNCDILEEYCLGVENKLGGGGEIIKPFTLSTAVANIDIMSRWAQVGREELKSRLKVTEKLPETDGSVKQIANLLHCTPSDKVEGNIWKNLVVRRSVYGDICQNETNESLKEILLASGNDSHIADEIMHLRAAYSGKRSYQPPSFYEEGNCFTKPPSFSVPYDGVQD